MHILLYETGSGFGGSSVSLYRLVKNLDRERFTPHVIVHGVGPKIEEISAMGVSVQALRFANPFPSGGTRKFLRSASFYSNFLANSLVNSRRIHRIIRDADVKLVHLNNGIFEGFPALLAARASGIPCITHVRGTVPITRLERMAAPWVRKVITLNSHMQHEYAASFGRDKVALIFNGVDLDRYDHVPAGMLRKKYNLSRSDVLVGTIARLVPGKGIPEFLSAASIVSKKCEKAVFIVVGDDPFGGSFEEEQKRLCRDLGIEKNVRFTGWQNEIPHVLADLDLVVQVSTFPEGMSLVPIEAMALAKPVITSDVPGYSDTVADRSTGYVVPKGDTGILAERILQLIVDRQLAETMGRLGRKRVEENFDSRLTARKIETAYCACLDLEPKSEEVEIGAAVSNQR